MYSYYLPYYVFFLFVSTVIFNYNGDHCHLAPNHPQPAQKKSRKKYTRAMHYTCVQTLVSSVACAPSSSSSSSFSSSSSSSSSLIPLLLFTPPPPPLPRQRKKAQDLASKLSRRVKKLPSNNATLLQGEERNAKCLVG